MAMNDLDRLSAAAIVSCCDEYRSDDFLDSLDRAELSRHFGGGSLHPNETNQGLVSDNNWLQGHKYLSRAYRQIFSIATSSAGFIEARVKASSSPQRRRLVERVGNECINKTLKRSRRFRFNYAGACGDAILYGAPYLYRWNKWDWLPTYAGKPLMPRNAPADVNDDEFSRWAFVGTLSAANIMGQLKRSKKDKKGKWNVKGLRDALKQLKNEMNPDKGGLMDTTFDEEDPERLEYLIQANALTANLLNTSVQVYYFFQKRPDGKIDISIVNRNEEKLTTSLRGGMVINRDGITAGRESELFYGEARFDNVNECLWPLILDVKFGGKPSAHRIKGLGRLNYNLDYAVSELMNAGLAGLNDDFTPLYQAGDNASLRKLDEMIQAGVRRGSVFPADISTFEKGTNARNYGNLLTVMGVLDVGQSSNAASHALGTNGGKGPRELEVQALERQQTNVQDITSRMEDWGDMGDPMCHEMVRTLTTRPLQKGDRAWDDRQHLVNLLREKGVDIRELHIDLLDVTMRRHLGAGDNALALQRAEKKVTNLHLYPAQSHPIIIREWSAAVDNSYQRALELVPEQEPENPAQEHSANLEEALALSSGQAPPVNPTTIPAFHVARHIERVSGILEQNQQGGIDQITSNGVAALLEHAVLEIQVINAIQPDLANQFMEAVTQLAKVAQEITRPAPTSKEEFDMQMKARSQELQEGKRSDNVEKTGRQQQHREKVDSQNLSLKMDEAARRDRAMALQEEQAFDSAQP